MKRAPGIVCELLTHDTDIGENSYEGLAGLPAFVGRFMYEK
jgi:hypothetical protein